MASTSSPTITVREATLSDSDAIADVGRHTFATTFGHAVEPHSLQTYLSEAYTPDAISADISSSSKTVLVAVDNQSEILGFGMLERKSEPLPDISHLSKLICLGRLYVDVKHHGKGIGSLLAERMFEIARGEKSQWMWLTVWENQPVARKVYEKLGFKAMGETRFKIGEDEHRDIVMVKDLSVGVGAEERQTKG